MGVPLACSLLAVALPVSAQAAYPSPGQRQVYRISLRLYKATLAISDNAVTANAKTVGNELAACISALQTPSVPHLVVRAIATEMSTQYVTATEHPLVKALVTASQQTAQLLPIRSRVRSELQTMATRTSALFTLDTCRDVGAWQAASFAPGSEPAGTQQASAWLATPTLSVPKVLDSLMTAHQRRAIAPIRSHATGRVRHLGVLTIQLLKAWVAQNGG
jgi:hypothetical protein